MYNVFNMKKVKEYRPNYLSTISNLSTICVPVMTGFILPKVCKGDFSDLSEYLVVIALLAGIDFLGWLISFLCKPYLVVGEKSFSTHDGSFLCDTVTAIEIELIPTRWRLSGRIIFYQGNDYLTEIKFVSLSMMFLIKKHFKKVKIKGLFFEIGLMIFCFILSFFLGLP